MFLHLVSDEKFIDDTIACFLKNDPGNHLFVYLVPSAKPPVTFKYLKKSNFVKFIVVHSSEYDNLLKKLSGYTAVYIHSLIPPYFVEFVNKAEKDVVFVWLFWGAEFWNLNKYKKKSYLPFTKALFYKHQIDKHIQKLFVIFSKYSKMLLNRGLMSTAKTSVNNLIHPKKTSFRVTDSDVLKAMRRANFLIPVVDEDCFVLKKYINCQAEALDWNYSPGLSFEKLDMISNQGNHLLIGNSGFYTNNHLDIFLKLRRHASCFNKIIVPLSYGNPKYINDVVRVGELLWENRFCPLKSFLPVQEYFKCISQCRIAIYNSRRQQALANIIVCLYLGMKVFLRKENPIYQFMIKNGVKLYAIENGFNHKLIHSVLSEEKKEHNKRIIRELYSEEVLDRKTKELNQRLIKSKLSGSV